jgi:ribose transport system substrate-binding protein
MKRMAMKSGLLAGIAIATLAASSPAFAADPICKKADIRLVNSMREIAQPFHAALDKGGRLFAKWAGLSNQYVLQLNQGDSDKQVSLMRSLLATKPECTIFNVEPNSDTAFAPMIETANETGAWLVTHWGHPDSLKVVGNDHWMAHVAVDSVEAGVDISKALVDAIGGEGGIVALEGRLDTDTAQGRFKGLQKVLSENPKVKLLDHQTANWDRTAAFPITQAWLTKYGDKIKGVWAGNDDMALGALEALRAAGLAGKIPIVGVDGIPESIQAVEKGEMTTTVSSDATYQGSIGLALGYCVVTGQLPAPKDWPAEHRDFFLKLVVINKSNAARYLVDPVAESYVDTWQCDKVFSRSTGPAAH